MTLIGRIPSKAVRQASEVCGSGVREIGNRMV